MTKDKKIVLTKKQKEVIKMMRNGCVLRKSVWDNAILTDEKGFTFRVGISIRYSLVSKKLIEGVMPLGTYSLTELGKTIEL